MRVADITANVIMSRLAGRRFSDLAECGARFDAGSSIATRMLHDTLCNSVDSASLHHFAKRS